MHSRNNLAQARSGPSGGKWGRCSFQKCSIAIGAPAATAVPSRSVIRCGAVPRAMRSRQAG
ncbi:hypothetical protein CCS01_15035 [Rhodopila globiformis]|uniref:Uncharacterized protein n=1 Tax=Rhodopila globiformis TaxID=1071 RepID=A0A2S6NEE7_RHOGL|nr:hypothetical protein CCS01_15035 [Rhodopila globiformis]